MASSHGRNAHRSRPLACEVLETRDTPSFGGVGGLSIAIGNLVANNLAPGNPSREFVLGSGPGVESNVSVYDQTGRLLREFDPFPGFTGGVNVATANITDDSVDEIIVAPAAGGGPIVRVFTGDGRLVRQILAYEPSFRGGVYVAGGRLAGNTTDDIVTGTGPGGGPAVKVFDSSGNLHASFFAYESSYRGGVNVDVANLDRDLSRDEIVTGTGTGGSPLVKIFDGNGTYLRSFYAGPSTLREGVTVAAGRTQSAAIEGTVYTYIPNYDGAIRVFNGLYGFSDGSFTPYFRGYTNSINMAVGDFNYDLRPDLAVVAGIGPVHQQPRIFYGGTTSPAGFNGP